MEWKRWQPVYHEIIDFFGYSEEKDLESAILLGRLRGSDDLEILHGLEGKTVEIQGPLMEEPYCDIQIVAGSAASRCEDRGAEPYLLVTDLDGNTDLQLDMNIEGTPTVIHAHGDNMHLIERWATRFTGHVISTCQCEPVDRVYNFGGFTDGDRAVFIADHFGAREILLNGWDLDHPVGKNKEEKKLKLRWAKKLLRMVDTPIRYLDQRV